MNDDFIIRLGHALREAAEREERRAAPERAALAIGAQVPRLGVAPALAALAVAAMIAVAVAVVVSMRPEPAQPPEPKIVARLEPGGVLPQLVPGFGSAWLLDTTNDRLLQMDPLTRRVTARTPLRSGFAIAAGDGAIWVGERVNDVLRINPRTGEIAARIRLPNGPDSGGFPMPVGNALWVVGAQRATRIDPHTNRVTKTVTLAHSGYSVRGATVLGGDVLVFYADRQVIRLDGRTGKRTVAFRVPFGGDPAVCGGALLLANTSEVARLDPKTGRAVWRRAFDHVGPCTTLRGQIWAEAPDRNGDRVVGIDPRNGRIVASVHVGEFGALCLERVGAELWLTTAGGHVVVVRP